MIDLIPDNITVTPTMRDQIAAMCKETDQPYGYYGMRIYANSALPENGYILRAGNQLIECGYFGQKPNDRRP